MLFLEVGTLTVPQQWRRYEILYIHFQLEFFFSVDQMKNNNNRKQKLNLQSEVIKVNF